MCAFYDAPGSFETTPGTTVSAVSASRKTIGRAAGRYQAGLSRRLQSKAATCARDSGSEAPLCARGNAPRPRPRPEGPPSSGPTWMTLRLRPVMSASFCRVCASGLLSCANCACITCGARGCSEAPARRGLQGPGPIRGSGLQATPQTAAARLATRGSGRGGVRRTSQPRPYLRPAHTWPLSACPGTCNCSAVKDVRARLAGLG